MTRITIEVVNLIGLVAGALLARMGYMLWPCYGLVMGLAIFRCTLSFNIGPCSKKDNNA